MFSSISRLFLRWGHSLDPNWIGTWPDFPVDPPLEHPIIKIELISNLFTLTGLSHTNQLVDHLQY